MGGDLEAFPNYDREYTKMEYTPDRKPRSRSPSPTRTPLFRLRRIRCLLLRICILITAFIFMFTSVDRICNTTLLAQGIMTYVLPVDSVRGSSPLLHNQQFRPWGVKSQTSDGAREQAIIPPEAVLRKQEDDTGVRRIHNILHNKVVNNSIIFVPVKQEDKIWVDNLHCRINGHFKQRNIVYWAMEEKAAITLQEKRYKFFYSPLLEARLESTRRIEEGLNKIRLWKWVLKTGVDLLWMEPSVALFKNPLEGLKMDANIEGIVSKDSLEEAQSEENLGQLGTGIMFMKAGPDISILLDTVYTSLNQGKYQSETEALNAILHSNPTKYLSLDNPSLPPSNTTSTSSTAPSSPVLSYRTISPYTYLNYPIFEKDIHLHTSGYSSAFSLRESSWDVDRFYPTILYVQQRDLERFERRKRDAGSGGLGRMVQRWKSLGWWELDDEGKCALLASRPRSEGGI